MKMVRGSHQIVSAGACLLLFALGGCAPTKPAHMMMPFAPPAPAKTSSVTLPDPARAEEPDLHSRV